MLTTPNLTVICLSVRFITTRVADATSDITTASCTLLTFHLKGQIKMFLVAIYFANNFFVYFNQYLETLQPSNRLFPRLAQNLKANRSFSKLVRNLKNKMYL